MSINPKIFRAYDIRGHVDDLSLSTIYAIAKALCLEYQRLEQRRIVIGYDARLNSASFAQIIADIFKNAHFQVAIIGQCSTPMLFFSARQYAGNGIMVTASHNPKHDNGIKWIYQNQPPSPEEIQHIGHLATKLYQNDHHQATSPIHSEFESFFKDYSQFILEDIQIKKTYTVILDGLNGSAGHIAHRILTELGCNVIDFRCDANGHFPHHAPDPSVKKHLYELQKLVIQHQADLGIALDGDGDRLVLIDELGNIIDADRLLCLFSEICLKKQPFKEIVYDVKCSTMVKHCIFQHQGVPKMIRTGSSFLRRYLLEQKGKTIFAGEFSGHYAFFDGRGLGYDDAIYAALRVLEFLSQTNQSLNQALQNYPERFATEDIYIPTFQYPVNQVFDYLQSFHFKNCKINHIDGLRFDFETGFIIFRASNTGDYFTLRFDADTASELKEAQTQLIIFLKEKYPQLAQAIQQIVLQ